MKKSNRIVFLSAIVICMLAMPAMADYNANGWPVETRVNGTVNGGVFHDSIGWTESTTQTLVTDVPNGTVKYAYLYTGVWGGHSTGWMNVSFNGDCTSNELGPIHLEETSDGNDNVWCTGQGKYWLWYNVTNLVNTGQVNTATTSKINGSIDGRIYGTVLVVVYEGGDDPKQIQYWINDGSDALSSDNPEGTTNFVGTVNTDNIAMANLTMVHLTGYSPPCSDCTKFNGNVLDTSVVNTNEFDMHTWDVTNYMEASGNDVWFSQGLDAYVNICNTILTVEYEPELNAPDLNVTDVLVNPGNVRYENIVRVYANQSNNISAVVQNNGPEDITDDFDVCFEADGVNIGCATVTGGLSAGANTTISIDWTPTCADYPVMPGFPAQSLPLTINVTVDCNCSNCPTCLDGSCGTITESDETNNLFSKVIPTIQVFNTFNVIGGVVDNGYKSKNIDCNTSEEPLDQFKYYNLNGGGVEYNVSGAKISSFAPEATDTRIHHIDLPNGATVKDARLYVYWYDKWGNYNTYPTGCLANLGVNFSGIDLMPDTVYQDSKAFGFYQSPKGSSVFNVTSLISGSGDYTAIVENIESVGGNGTTLLGEMLVVIYEGADHGNEVRIWMLEGTDYLMAADDTHGSKDFSVSPEEATATVSFPGGAIDPENVNTARLITVVVQGMELESDMLFNGNVIKTDAWDTPTEAYSGSKINVEDVSVMSNLLASNNNMGFRDKGTTGMQASNAILIVEETTSLPDLVVSNVYPQYIFTNLTNVLSVNVTNQGTASAASCDVNLTITHTGGPTVLTATVPALNASESVVVEVGNCKPIVLENILITAFADSDGVVDEGANEGNNDLTVSRNTTGDCAVDDMLPDTCFGYCGDNPMTTAYEGTGSVVYSVGDFKYKNNTVNFNIGASGDENQVDGLTADIPDDATIKNATLYVYYTYRKSATGPNPGADPRPDYEMSIDGGSTLTTDEYYTDIKGFTSSEYQYGTLVYDVTDNVTGNGAYQAVRSNCNNTDPILKGKGYVSGMALMVIYDDGSDNTYAIAHGYDRLATSYKTEYNVLPEDATTTATLTDVDPNLIATANLLTVTVDAVASGSESEQFNTRSWDVGAWDCISGVPTCNWNYPLGINRDAVDKSDITASGTDELVKFQERTSNGFAPLFACLQTAPSADITPPVISNVENTDPTTDSVTISWDTDEESDSVVRYGTTSGNYTELEYNATMVSLHSISLTGLNATTTYYYVVNSTDASGNAGEGSEYYFTTTAISDITTILIDDAIAAPNGYAFTSVMVNNVTGLGSGMVSVTFEPSAIQVIDVTSGDGNALTVQDVDIDNTAGLVQITAWDADEPHNGNVVFANLTLHSVGDHLGSTALDISSAELINYDTYEPITHNVATGILDTIAPVVIIDNAEAAPGEYTTALVMVNNASNLGSGSITVTYNSSVVHVTSVTSGDGNALALQDWNVDNSTGSVQIFAQDADISHNGDVVFANVTFHVVGEYPGSTPLSISSSELIDYTSYGIIGHNVTNGIFSIIDNEPPVITDAIATLDIILNDNGRPRVPGTNVTVLNATVLDIGSGVANVTIDLSGIGGSDDQVMERIAGTDVWTVATNATEGINLTHELVVTASDKANNTNTSVIGLTVLLRGDVVRDGNLNSADALYIAKYLVGKEPMPSLLVSDMSPDIGDGRVTSADALYLAKYLVGKEAAP